MVEERGAPQSLPRSGWYPDPYGAARLRWWDGRVWTDDYRPWPEPPQAPKTSGWAIASLVLGIIGGALLAIVFGLIARSRIKKSGGRLGGNGLAIAGIALGCAWLALVAGVVALAATGVFDEEPNASRFAGERREVAQVVDRFQAALEDERPTEICQEILTPGLARTIAAGAGQSCETFFGDTVRGKDQASIKIERLDVRGTRAVVIADEGGEPLRLSLVDDGLGWRIARLD